MLPIELLRVSISSKMNHVRPVFCSHENELSLPSKIIRMYEEMAEKKVSKAIVDENILGMEDKHTDYKFVRGICHLLEQRCVYSSYSLANSESTANGNANANNAIYLRREIFEESSRSGYPVTENERRSILQKIALKNDLTIEDLELAMWNDLDRNKYLKSFDSLTSPQLVAWYNLSILQTLLLNCVKLEFSVSGGYNWKKILHKIKQLGLMYFLFGENSPKLSTDNQIKNQNILFGNDKDKKIKCAVDGPLSILRSTDRYGSAMAKLIPLIIFTDSWSINAVILRKSVSGAKKTYNFKLSSSDEGLPIFDASEIGSNSHSQSSSKSNSESSFDNDDFFDSNVEKNFMNKFLTFSTKWKLSREPDPLILTDGKAFIPDFLFEKSGYKVYFEIVGFWTTDYLKRKLEKLKDLSTNIATTLNIDLLIAANKDNYISENGDKIGIDSIFSKFIDKKQLIFYKKDEIPFGPIIKYLKEIDSRIIDDITVKLHDTLTRVIERITEDYQNKVVFLEQVADKFDIPVESILKTIRDLQSNNNHIVSKEATLNGLNNFLLIDNYMISVDKISKLLPELDKISKLQDAVNFLSKNGIPEECITLLIPKIGFEIIWNGIDSNNALIQRQAKKNPKIN
jgi:predicted nuclease of restriction endonuclease-like RecB superfamily